MKNNPNTLHYREQLGRNIKYFRECAKMSQTDLAKYIGSESASNQRSVICKIENGQRWPSMQVLLNISSALDVPLDALIGNNGNSVIKKYYKLTPANKQVVDMMIDNLLSVQEGG